MLERSSAVIGLGGREAKLSRQGAGNRCSVRWFSLDNVVYQDGELLLCDGAPIKA